MSRKIRKFRTDKFDKRLGTSRSHELHESKFPFFHYRIYPFKLSNFLLMYPGSEKRTRSRNCGQFAARAHRRHLDGRHDQLNCRSGASLQKKNRTTHVTRDSNATRITDHNLAYLELCFVTFDRSYHLLHMSMICISI